MSASLSFRQIHLDFHTSPAIEGIGANFDAGRYVERLQKARVNSITTFATCHHGWAYFDSKVVDRHPHLEFDLLRAQFDACKAADIRVPIYLTAGVNNRAAELHPEWREINQEGTYAGWAQSPLSAGFHKMCFNTPYLDHLCEAIREVATLFPNCDGIFLDIISQGQCCCRWCLADMQAQGFDPLNEDDRLRFANDVALEKYYRRTTEAARHADPNMGIFHNSGHIHIGSTRRLKDYFSHLELESLPTGGWGYDHFPMSARYVTQLPHQFLGMTGKFHTTWGEFGGFKHPNALRYECAAMLAFGARCSVGDQLHPTAELDEGTYDIIGAAYSEVEAREAWVEGATGIADVAILSTLATNPHSNRARESAGDVGAGRLLLESHVPFNVIDTEMDLAPYKALILPDDNQISAELARRLAAYVADGGKLFLSGKSGVKSDGSGFLFDVGADHAGSSPFSPDFLAPIPELRPGITPTPFVSYTRSERIRVTDGTSLGAIHDPWFNRTYAHFCSHQHAPNRPEPSGFDLGVQKGNILYLATPIFSLYRGYGNVAVKQFFQKCLQRLLAGTESVKTNLPSTARLALTDQPAHRRYVLHLLYANTIARGGKMNLSGGTVSEAGLEIQVVEDLLPLHDVEVTLRLPNQPTRATLEPQGTEIPTTQGPDGTIKIHVDSFTCHQMVALHY